MKIEILSAATEDKSSSAKGAPKNSLGRSPRTRSRTPK